MASIERTAYPRFPRLLTTLAALLQSRGGGTGQGRQARPRRLTWKVPRAWVVADGGKVNWAAGTNPKDPTQPKDPVERALRLCHEQGKTGCTLYAMDNRVVYIKPENTSQR